MRRNLGGLANLESGVLILHFRGDSNLASYGIEQSAVPWKRIIRGRKGIAFVMLGSCTISSGENCFKDFSPSIML